MCIVGKMLLISLTDCQRIACFFFFFCLFFSPFFEVLVFIGQVMAWLKYVGIKWIRGLKR